MWDASGYGRGHFHRPMLHRLSSRCHKCRAVDPKTALPSSTSGNARRGCSPQRPCGGQPERLRGRERHAVGGACTVASRPRRDRHRNSDHRRARVREAVAQQRAAQMHRPWRACAPHPELWAWPSVSKSDPTDRGGASMLIASPAPPDCRRRAICAMPLPVRRSSTRCTPGYFSGSVGLKHPATPIRRQTSRASQVSKTDPEPSGTSPLAAPRRIGLQSYCLEAGVAANADEPTSRVWQAAESLNADGNDTLPL